jgi:urease accessory protein
MDDFPKAVAVVAAPPHAAPVAEVCLDYDARFIRRKRLVTVCGRGVLVDLAETVSLAAGECLQLADGNLIVVRAAEEDVLKVTGDHLPRLAWHIGNRHTPCQIEAAHLLIRRDHVLEAMLRGLGADVHPTTAPFTPEGGAYGHGRTLGHDHGPDLEAKPTFAGFHHHGDGKMHFHAPLPIALPIGHKDAGR